MAWRGGREMGGMALVLRQGEWLIHRRWKWKLTHALTDTSEVTVVALDPALAVSGPGPDLSRATIFKATVEVYLAG
jgi:hypothetical protein